MSRPICFMKRLVLSKHKNIDGQSFIRTVVNNKYLIVYHSSLCIRSGKALFVFFSLCFFVCPAKDILLDLSYCLEKLRLGHEEKNVMIMCPRSCNAAVKVCLFMLLLLSCIHGLK